MKHIIPYLFLFISFLPAPAVEYRVSSLTLEQGLSCNYVVDAECDKGGFLWFATEEGLNRFDGQRFFSYYKQRGRQQSLSSSELNCILDDATNPVLWIGTKNDGLNAFNYVTEEFSLYLHDSNNAASLATNDITDICHAENGNLWLSTYWQGVEHMDVASGRFTHYSTRQVRGLPDNQLWCVLDIGGGMLAVGHVRSGFSLIDTRTHTARNYRHSNGDPSSIAGDEVCKIFRDHQGLLWVGTNAGLDVFDPTNQRFIHICAEQIGHNRVYDIRELSNGNICVATELKGLALLNPASRPFAASSQMQCTFIGEGETDSNLSGNSVRCIIEDTYHNLWAGLYGGGVNFLTTNSPLFSQLSYGFHNQVNRLTEKSVMGLTLDRNGNLWIGTDGNGLNVFSPQGQRTASYPSEAGRTVQAAFTDSKGNLWFGSFLQGAFVRRNGSPSFTPVKTGEREDVRCFMEDRKGQVWIGTSHGLYVADGTTQQVRRHYDCGNGLVRAVTADHEGRIWVGYYGAGIEVYTPDFRLIASFKKENGRNALPSNAINHLLTDSRHRVWAATNEGAVCFTPKGKADWTTQTYDQTSGLENAHIRAIAEDRQGTVWLSTNRGISCQTKPDTPLINFNEKDNVMYANFNDGSVATDRQGRICFGSARGLCYFSPSQVLSRHTAPRVFITSLMLAGGVEGGDSIISLVNRKKITLDHNENTFTVNFNIQNFAFARYVEYGYLLEGLQSDWMTTANGSITLRNIPCGTYKLLVRARMHNQPWTAEMAEMTITVRPPIWFSWWAKGIYLLLAVAAFIYALRIYQRHVRLKYRLHAETINREKEQNLNEERLRFFTNITHELRTPVTLILGPLDDISHQSDISKSAKHKLAVIHQSAVRLNELINQILEFRKTQTSNRALCVEHGNIVDTVHEICLKYEELAVKPNVGFRFVAPDPAVEMYFDKEVMAIIVDNLVSNALKYTDRGSIDISVERRRSGDRHLVDITVSDTGHGISAKALPHIFDRYFQENGRHQASGTGIGLSLVKSLVTLHEGEVKVESSLEQGTSFIVTLDEQNVYPNALHGRSNETSATENGSNLPAEDEAPGENGNTRGSTSDGKPIMLVVEDNKDILNYVAESFDDEYVVLKAANGRQGLALALDRLPDVIISDVMMPEMDGNEMCRTLKNDLRTSHIPVILLTAKDSLEDKEAGYESGADSYLTKPFTHSLLRARINNLLAQRQHFFQTPEVVKEDSLAEKKEQLRESMTKVDKAFFDRLDAMIMQNIRGDVDVNMLASELAVSPSTLYRKMKALTGMTTNSYIRKIKMQYAERLLLEGKYTISEVSFMVGMNSVAYFRRCFKEAYGDIPSEYLKKIRG